MSNIIYVLTNSAIPDHVKIGKTANLERRVKDLSCHSGVPKPFKVFYACEVSNATIVEKHILEAFNDYRSDTKKEFLKIDPEKLVWVLKLVEDKDVTPKVGSVEDELKAAPSTISSESKTSRNQSGKSPRSPFTFSLARVPLGSKLHFVDDDRVTAVVHDDRKVKFKGQVTSLSQSAREVLNKKYGRKKDQALAGTWFWKYKNEILAERRLRFEK